MQKLALKVLWPRCKNWFHIFFAFY